LLLKDTSPGASQLPWGYHDHVITLAVAKTGARLFIREKEYIFLRHYNTDTSKNCT